MKKKFLSLMMAAAMVATTSISAFANDKELTGEDTSTPTTNVEIKGSVANAQGQLPAGNFNVTVPTRASFSVTKNGVINAGEIKIKNAGEQKIEVYAYAFKDKSGDKKINIVKANQVVGDSTNATMSLFLTGDSEEKAYLSSTGKIYKNENHETEADKEDGVKLLTLLGGTTSNPKEGSILMDGQGGNVPETNPVSDEFTLTLKIKKVEQNNN